MKCESCGQREGTCTLVVELEGGGHPEAFKVCVDCIPVIARRAFTN
jgi:hypothetical protein